MRAPLFALALPLLALLSSCSSDAPAPAPTPTPVTRATFADLYADFFGPTGRATCAKSNCHSQKGDLGEVSSGGYVCAPDKDSCYTNLVSATLKPTSIPQGKTATDSLLYKTLRHEETGGKLVGSMPFDKSYIFTADDMRRIQAWLEAGAKND